jgi:hypothetical protein
MLVLWAMLTAISWRLIMRERRRAIALAAQYQLYAVRDELRDYAIRNPAARRSWLFDYFDSFISRLVGLVPNTSIWQLFAVMIARHDDLHLAESQRHLTRELAKPHNQGFAEIHGKALLIANRAVYQRHVVLFGLVRAAVTVSATARRIESARLRAIRWLAEPPNKTECPDEREVLAHQACPI